MNTADSAATLEAIHQGAWQEGRTRQPARPRRLQRGTGDSSPGLLCGAGASILKCQFGGTPRGEPCSEGVTCTFVCKEDTVRCAALREAFLQEAPPSLPFSPAPILQHPELGSNDFFFRGKERN